MLGAPCQDYYAVYGSISWSWFDIKNAPPPPPPPVFVFSRLQFQKPVLKKVDNRVIKFPWQGNKVNLNKLTEKLLWVNVLIVCINSCWCDVTLRGIPFNFVLLTVPRTQQKQSNVLTLSSGSSITASNGSLGFFSCAPRALFGANERKRLCTLQK